MGHRAFGWAYSGAATGGTGDHLVAIDMIPRIVVSLEIPTMARPFVEIRKTENPLPRDSKAKEA